MYSLGKFLLFLLVLLFVFCAPFNHNTKGKTETEGLVLEWEQHWETYGVGGTCNFGTHNFFVGDVDSDGILEMVTGGITYNVSEETRSDVKAPLRIWNWNGDIFTLEKGYNWAGTIRSIYATDVDDDGRKEIITGGHITNRTGSYPSLRIWSWNNTGLTLKSSYEGVDVRSIFGADVDRDKKLEVLTAGRTFERNKSSAQLCVWQWEEDHLALRGSAKWSTAGEASANSVYAHDLNDDGKMEIITGGYDHGLMTSSGQLCIWHWNGEEFFRKEEENWRLKEGVGATFAGNAFGNTLVNNLKVGDVDGDGTAEVVTGGFTYDGKKVAAELRIWNWNGAILSLEESHRWTEIDITEIKALALDDVDGDKRLDIVTSGNTASYLGFTDQSDVPQETAQLKVWSWNGKTLTLKQSESWQVGEGVCAWNVDTGDVDKDGTVEIVTVGCMYISGLCDPDLRIWSVTEEASGVTLYPVLAALGVTTVIVMTFLFLKRR